MKLEIKTLSQLQLQLLPAEQWLTVRLWRPMEDHSEDVESHEEDGGERWYSLLLLMLFDGDKLLSWTFLDFSFSSRRIDQAGRWFFQEEVVNHFQR